MKLQDWHLLYESFPEPIIAGESFENIVRVTHRTHATDLPLALASRWALQHPGLQVFVFEKDAKDSPIQNMKLKNGSAIHAFDVSGLSSTAFYGVEMHAALFCDLAKFSEEMYREIVSSVRVGPWQQNQDEETSHNLFPLVVSTVMGGEDCPLWVCDMFKHLRGRLAMELKEDHEGQLTFFQADDRQLIQTQDGQTASH